MGQIERLVVVRVHAHPFAADDLVRAQEFGRAGIVDDAADLVTDEPGRGVVGLRIDEQVGEGAEERQPTVPPSCFVLCLSLLGAHRQGGEIGPGPPLADCGEHPAVGGAERSRNAP